MSDLVKCACSHCGAKYRLPIEAQGRVARCKRCGEKFEVPKEQNLEDTILSWLSAAEEEEETAEEAATQPRVINMPTEHSGDSVAGKKLRGPIRMKTGTSKSE